ncbi:catalase [Rhizobium sp. Leaf384]|uniref:catalase family protein n=1 Tax=unclassified Rhizobium TaxID=2613769 RepID=UPI0007145E5D|nr:MULTISPECIES: catalase family protein [unclassified Rhizobium]KQS77063.1 catalase [Rhizobium sp. Leaf384]KQS78334.1 catalase [Rhizobium sp. Leaf383]
MTQPPVKLEHYRPDVETIEKDEPETSRALAETLLSIAHTTWRNGGHAVRSVHAKSHGLLEGTLEILPDLPASLAQGMFAKPGRHEAIVRLSTSPGDILHDSVSTPRGFSLKILDVEGERLPGGLEGSTSQDFLMVNGKQFNSPSAKAFLANLKGLALTTDRMERTKEVASKVFRAVEGALEAFGAESATLKSLGGHPETHILGESFFTQLPHRYGEHIAKFALVPVSENLKALKDQPIDANTDEDALRHAVRTVFASETAVWELQVQLCSDLESMPVEDASAIWDEAKSPFISVARLTVPPQDSWTADKQKRIDDGLSFRPWNGISAHQPLGSIMRMRREAYDKSAAFRSERNPVPVREPGARCPVAAV